jgi:SAM-dependent methyltransferase
MSGKDRSTFADVFGRHMAPCGIDPAESVLVVGGSAEDARMMVGLGFSDLTVTNLAPSVPTWEDLPGVKLEAADAEDIPLPDRSFDMVFVHESLHHCRSPHRALCEMARVARRHVVMLEPNESRLMSALTRLGLSSPYETAVVLDYRGERGGVNDSHVPNYLYRWTGREVDKTVSAYLAERQVRVVAEPYWDFNAEERDLGLRQDTYVGAISRVVGPARLLGSLRRWQRVLNRVGVLRRQGNKFFACVTILDGFKPWLVAEGEGTAFNLSWRPEPGIGRRR